MPPGGLEADNGMIIILRAKPLPGPCEGADNLINALRARVVSDQEMLIALHAC